MKTSKYDTHELEVHRRRLNVTQTQYAEMLGLSVRGYEEALHAPVRKLHLLAARMVEQDAFPPVLKAEVSDRDLASTLGTIASRASERALKPHEARFIEEAARRITLNVK